MSPDLKDKKELWMKTSHGQEGAPTLSRIFLPSSLLGSPDFGRPGCTFQGLHVQECCGGQENPRKAPGHPSLLASELPEYFHPWLHNWCSLCFMPALHILPRDFATQKSISEFQSLMR